MDKKFEYDQLVEKRLNCNHCENLTNPSEFPDMDSCEINPWSLWQGNLNADILLVGKDWGGVEYFLKNEGRDSGKFTTDRNLVYLFNNVLGIPLRNPREETNNELAFFTNVVLCLREGSLTTKTEKVDDAYLKKCSFDCAKKYLRPLIGIINPKVVITLGKIPYDAVMTAYYLKAEKNLIDAVESQKSIYLGDTTRLFPVYHCGGKGLIIRNFETHIKDWERIKSYLDSIE